MHLIYTERSSLYLIDGISMVGNRYELRLTDYILLGTGTKFGESDFCLSGLE